MSTKKMASSINEGKKIKYRLSAISILKDACLMIGMIRIRQYP
jgi:hypothetical protein